MALARNSYATDNMDAERLGEMGYKNMGDIMMNLTERKRARDFMLGGVDMGKSPLGNFLLGNDDEITDPDYLFWKDQLKFLPNQIKGTYGKIDPFTKILQAREFQTAQRRAWGALAGGMAMENITSDMMKNMGADVWSPGYDPKQAKLFFVTADKMAGHKGNDLIINHGDTSGPNNNLFPTQKYDRIVDQAVIEPTQFGVHVDNGVLLNSYQNIPKPMRKPDKIFHFKADHMKATGGSIRPQLIRGHGDRLKFRLGPDKWHRFGNHFVDDQTMTKENFVPYKEGMIHASDVISLKQNVRNNSLQLADNYLQNPEHREKLSKSMVGSGLVNKTTIDAVKKGGTALMGIAKNKLVSQMPTIADTILSKGKNVGFNNAISTGSKIIAEGTKAFQAVKSVGSRIKGLFRKKRPAAAAAATTAVPSSSSPPPKKARVVDEQTTTAAATTTTKRKKGRGGQITPKNKLLSHLQHMTYY